MKYESKLALWIRSGGQHLVNLNYVQTRHSERKFSISPERLLDSVVDNAMMQALTVLNGFLPQNTSFNIIKLDNTLIYNELSVIVAQRIQEVGLPLDLNDPVISIAIQRYAALLNARFQSDGLGILNYIWRSRDDAQVRPIHRSFDDQHFAWANPPLGGHPGEAYGCRCIAEPVLGGVAFPEGAICTVINSEMLSSIFTDAPKDQLEGVAFEIDAQIKVGKLDSLSRLVHFFGQVRQEAGTAARMEENLNYSATALSQLFSYFARNPEEAELYGRMDNQTADQEAIANRAYANRNGNGDVESGDGWRFRGRGLKQLTGRSNYRDFTIWNASVFNESVDFEVSPDLLTEPKYAVRSALFFWVANGLFDLADGGITEEVTDSITSIINQQTDSYAERWGHVNTIFQSEAFQNVCQFSTRNPRFDDE